jgi:hypothetical protein
MGHHRPLLRTSSRLNLAQTPPPQAAPAKPASAIKPAAANRMSHDDFLPLNNRYKGLLGLK